MKEAEETIKAYDAIAPEYCPGTRQEKFLEWEKSYIEKMLALIQDTHPLILDVGCGDGRHCKIIDELGAKSVGIDLSDAMLAQAWKYHPEGDIRKMDFRELEFPDAHFHGIWSSGSVYHVPKSEVGQVIAEYARVLRPGGIVAINFKLGSGEGMEQEPKSHRGAARYFAYYATEKMEGLFRRAGFELLKSCAYPEEVFGDELAQMWFRRI
jgi:ubiquinone/menaquinone biosynthesis C-methylase UbiE